MTRKVPGTNVTRADVSALMRTWGRRGGAARAKVLTAEERVAIAQRANAARRAKDTRPVGVKV